MTKSVFFLFSCLALADEPWALHTIDDTSKGADGVRLEDVNGDGFLNKKEVSKMIMFLYKSLVATKMLSQEEVANELFKVNAVLYIILGYQN